MAIQTVLGPFEAAELGVVSMHEHLLTDASALQRPGVEALDPDAPVVTDPPPVPETGVHMGRERGDVLFPEDGYVSGLHCRIAHENGKTYLTDLGSSNGTFLRLREELEVRSGEVLLMGQQLFRVSL